MSAPARPEAPRATEWLVVLATPFGQRGWFGFFCREVIRARQYLLRLFVVKRFVKDGWKLMRVRQLAN